MFVNYAHRGASEYDAENTFSSFYAGLDMGANGIETDVQRTRDGKLVLYHDDTLMRCTGAAGKVADYTYEELRQLEVTNAKTGRCDKIVLFEDFLHHFGWRDLTFAIELKVRGVVADAIAMMDRYGVRDKVIITSFNYDELVDAHALRSGYRLGYLYRVNKGDIDEKLHAIEAYQACPKEADTSAGEVARLRAAGYECRAWGIVDSDAMIRAVEKGFDGGMTVNFPDKLTAYLNNRK